MTNRELLAEWGFDVEKFEHKSKQLLSDLDKARGPIAADLKKGFERACNEIEQAFSRARQRVREARNEAKAPNALDEDMVIL